MIMLVMTLMIRGKPAFSQLDMLNNMYKSTIGLPSSRKTLNTFNTIGSVAPAAILLASFRRHLNISLWDGFKVTLSRPLAVASQQLLGFAAPFMVPFISGNTIKDNFLMTFMENQKLKEITFLLHT